MRTFAVSFSFPWDSEFGPVAISPAVVLDIIRVKGRHNCGKIGLITQVSEVGEKAVWLGKLAVTNWTDQEGDRASKLV